MRDDEKELVLGNKQLLSLFFVAAALCGICFALGYMMGRNATKSTLTPEQSAAAAIDGRRAQPDVPAETPTADPPTTPVTQTKPAQDPAIPPVAPAVDTKPAESRPIAPEPKPYAEATLDATASYLQVAALPRPDADAMVRTLREQHFPAMVGASPKPGFFRVLVGPYRQNVQLSDAKSKLKALGFNSAFVQKQ